MQDNLGFMWIGTQDGLNKYDGYQITIFKNDPTSKNSLSNNEITCMTQVRDNLIVIGTREGLSFFNPVNNSFEQLNLIKGLSSKVFAICKYSEQELLVGGEHGLCILNIETKGIKPFKFPVEGNVVVRCLNLNEGRAFIGTDGHGLWTIKNGQLEKVNLVKPDYIKMNISETESVFDLTLYGSKLYLGSKESGIFKIDLSTYEIDEKIKLSERENSNFLRKLEIKDNKIYAATGGGFFIRNLISGRTSSYFKNGEEFALNNDLIQYIYIDRHNNIWTGSQVGGVNVAFSQSLKFPSATDNDENKISDVYSFLEMKNGDHVIGGNKVIKIFDSKGNLKKDYSKLLQNNYALSLYQDESSFLWVGTWGIGLLKIDLNTGKSTTCLSPKFGGTVLCLKPDGNGHLYAGCVGDGLFKINISDCQYVNFGVKDGLPSASINNIFEDSKGNVWLGTYDGGAVKMRGYEKDGKLPIAQIYKNEGKSGQIPSNIVFGVNEGPGGNIWLATSAGLSKLDASGTVKNFYEKDGLSNSYLYSVIKDSVNNFWMSSNNGIMKFNPALQDKEIIFKCYGRKDGLLNNEYNIGACYSSASGNMYFGGANGFNVFRPTAIKDNLNPPKVYVVSYKRGGTDVATDSSITYKKHLLLSWSENYFQFELVALDYTDPQKNKFKYLLEGYDKTWSAPTNVRYVSYTELPGGEYVFKVKAANNDGTWNDTPYEIRITVVPPFWKTKTFYVIVVILVIAGIYGYTQYRTNAFKKANKILENKVAERTKELAEKNRDITSSIEYAKRIQEAILPPKEQIFSKLENAVFILYKPKDIVSGDFYWFGEKDGRRIFAVVDCTGHGVPGAFMSMIGHNLLHQIVKEKGITDPGEILNNLHKGVQEALRQGQNEINTNDGMDCSIIALSADGKGPVLWAGANRPLVLIDIQGNLVKYDGNKYPVGGVQVDINRKFITHEIKPASASMVYMFSDGYADQFGGDKGKKFMVKRFHDLLTSIHLHSPEEQRKELEQSFEQWRQNHEQVDDVLVVGIAI
jgi:ligand-binding sensor domain-containing protein/serine phosphatase RsbU (regulator of sigma subunit)